jgi:branched-chain amino acid transport system permease protein
MAIVGGARKILGPVIGCCLLLVIVTYLPAAETQGMIYGTALIIILLVAPQGLIGTDWWSIWRRRAPSKAAAPADKQATGPVAANVGECS